MEVPEVRTERLLLRHWRAEDRQPFAELNADTEVMRHFPAPLSRSESDRLVDRIELHFKEHGVGLWALEVLATGEFIGFTGLNPMPDGVPGAGGLEVGWRLARKSWGQGYAAEAARTALGVGFARLGLDEVWSITAEVNLRSIAVMERLGMQRHSTFEHPRVDIGHPLRPHVAYRVHREGWVGQG